MVYNLQPEHIILPLMKRILSKKSLPNASLMVFVKYVERLQLLIKDFKLFTVVGISHGEVLDNVRLVGGEKKARNIDRLLDYIRANPRIHDLCRSAEIVEHILTHFIENSHQCPETITSLYKALVEKVLAKHLDKSQVSIKDLDINHEDHFYSLCSLAYHLVEKNSETFNKTDFSLTCLLEQIPVSSPSFGLGLVQTLIHDGSHRFVFLHSSIQEFLSALHISRQPYFDQANMILNRLGPRLQEERIGSILKFLCGLCHTDLVKKSPLKINNMVLVPLLEFVSSRISVVKEPTFLKTQLILSCLYETQDPSIVKKLIQKRQAIFNVQFGDNMRSESELQMLAFIIVSSGIDQWKVEVPPEKRHIGDFLAMLVDQVRRSSELKPKIHLQVVDGFTYSVSPSHQGTQEPVKLKSNVYSRIIRELLHRLAQYHSPIKLKSDGSNVAYVSILACNCLKEAISSQLVLTFEPITALHWLEMRSKSSTEESPQNHSHMRSHGGQYIELVIMMTPFLHRIRFVVPGTREEVCIELSNSNSPNFLSTGIGSHIGDDVPMSRCFPQSNTEVGLCIVSPLPLPNRSHSRAETIAPIIPEPIREGRDQEGSPIGPGAVPTTENIPLQDSRYGREQLFPQSRQQEVPVIGGTAVSSPFNLTSGSAFVQQAQSQRPSTFKAGLIIHSVVQDIFASDQVYPLPDEIRLLRKGGNGEIYLGTFGGRELAVKKTAYRNREITIHSKLNHRNIAKLLCVMVGDRHQTQRRRWMCYHFMDKASGDLARLLLDDERNTLKALKATCPRNFGVIQGNVKFVLTQVLEALVYLHDQNIVHVLVVHRDL